MNLLNRSLSIQVFSRSSDTRLVCVLVFSITILTVSVSFSCGSRYLIIWLDPSSACHHCVSRQTILPKECNELLSTRKGEIKIKKKKTGHHPDDYDHRHSRDVIFISILTSIYQTTTFNIDHMYKSCYPPGFL